MTNQTTTEQDEIDADNARMTVEPGDLIYDPDALTDVMRATER